MILKFLFSLGKVISSSGHVDAILGLCCANLNNRSVGRLQKCCYVLHSWAEQASKLHHIIIST